jgi:hypothetical protein
MQKDVLECVCVCVCGGGANARLAAGCQLVARAVGRTDEGPTGLEVIVEFVDTSDKLGRRRVDRRVEVPEGCCSNKPTGPDHPWCVVRRKSRSKQNRKQSKNKS